MSDIYIYIYISEQDREVALITNLAFITRITTLVKPNQKVSCMRNKKTDAFSVRIQNCRQITVLREDRHLTIYAHLPHPAPDRPCSCSFGKRCFNFFFLKKLHQLLSWETYSKVMSLLTYEHRIYILRQSRLLSPDPGSFLWSLIMAMNLQHGGDC